MFQRSELCAGASEDLAKLSYYPVEDEMLNYDPKVQLPGLDAEETFQLDVSGYLHLRGAVTATELSSTSVLRLKEGKSDGRDPLRENAELIRLLTAMSGPDHRQDTQIEVLQPASLSSQNSVVPLRTIDPRIKNGREYFVSSDGMVLFRGVRVVWHIGNKPQKICVIPASHLSAVEPPAAVLRGQTHHGASVMLTMHPGDLLVFAATLLWGPGPAFSSGASDILCPQLVTCEYVCSTTYPSAGYEAPQPMPSWFNELRPEQRAVLVRQHGSPVWALPDGPTPSIHGNELSGATAHDIDLSELWFFDLTGYLVLSQVRSKKSHSTLFGFNSVQSPLA
eukprot:SAG31_NODE_5251_length_2649_cov_1.978039_2_plen_336_part_00